MVKLMGVGLVLILLFVSSVSMGCLNYILDDEEEQHGKNLDIRIDGICLSPPNDTIEIKSVLDQEETSFQIVPDDQTEHTIPNIYEGMNVSFSYSFFYVNNGTEMMLMNLSNRISGYIYYLNESIHCSVDQKDQECHLYACRCTPITEIDIRSQGVEGVIHIMFRLVSY